MSQPLPDYIQLLADHFRADIVACGVSDRNGATTYEFFRIMPGGKTMFRVPTSRPRLIRVPD